MPFVAAQPLPVSWFFRFEALPLSRSIVMRSSLFILTVLLIGLPLCLAQTGPEQGGHEIQIWAGGGHSVSGGRGNTGAFNAGLRYGWILTGRHLPGFLRGRFEYAVDAVPVFFVFQPADTAYGVGFDPLVLKWNFARHGLFSPYLELCGGTLFTNHNVPTGTNTVNFTDQAAFGVHILGAKHNVSLELRYMHISNAGLATPNPGINTVQVRLGVGKFLGGHDR
jgi:lipid A 3-O-deacylase